VDEPHPLLAELEAQIERQRPHQVLAVIVCVRERPRNRLLTELAVVLGDVRAPAILEVTGDRVVVIAIDRGDATCLDQRADLVGIGAIADKIAPAVGRVDADRVDRREARLERRQVAVNISDDCDPIHLRQSLRIDRYHFNRWVYIDAHRCCGTSAQAGETRALRLPAGVGGRVDPDRLPAAGDPAIERDHGPSQV
jgi:hypothetical protein